MSADYHADAGTNPPSLNASIAKILIEKTPLHAWYAHPRLNPNYKREEKAEFDYGTAAHDLILEGGTPKICVIQPEDYRSKPTKDDPDGSIPKGWTNNAIRKARDEAYSNGLTPLLPWDHAKIKRMADAAKTFVAQSELAGIFADGKPEQTTRWQEGETHFRMRTDWLKTDGSVILDYKTTTNAHPDAFLRQVVGLGYDVQESFYRRGIKAITGRAPLFVFLVQEKDEPFACSLVALDPAMRAMAEAKVQWAITLWSNCMATGKWNGYSNRIAYLEPPAWHMARQEEMMAQLEEEGVPL